MASLIANQMAIQSDAADLAWIEQEVERKIAMRQDRMESALPMCTKSSTESEEPRRATPNTEIAEPSRA